MVWHQGMREGLSLYLPTLERAREEGVELPPGEPRETHALAGLIVLARAVRRETWDETMLADDLASDVALTLASEPVDYELRVHAAIAERAKLARDGHVRVVVRHYTDRPVHVREMYVPTLPVTFAFESALEQLAAFEQTPPEVLRCEDLTPQRAGSMAYRGGGKVVAASFHGHAFGDAIDKGKAAVSQMGVRGTVFRRQVVAYAWPFLWLRYPQTGGAEEVIVVPDRAGKLHAVTPPPLTNV